MEYIDFLTWGVIAIVIALGFIFLANWLINRAFKSNLDITISHIRRSV